MSFAERLTQKSFAIVPLVALLLIGCNNPEPTPSQLAIRPQAQNDYDFGPERPAIDMTDSTFPGSSVPDSAAPRMTASTMTLKTGHARSTRRLLARITSSRDYPPMGIYAGVNYVWRNTWDTTSVAAARWTNIITPDATGRPDKRLVRDARLDRFPITLGLHEPSVVRLRVNSYAFEVCLDDPVCPSGHCGYY